MLLLYADECVDRRIINGLRRRGVDVVTAADEDLLCAGLPGSGFEPVSLPAPVPAELVLPHGVSSGKRCAMKSLPEVTRA